MSDQCPDFNNFREFLTKLGPTDRKRAAALNLTPRQYLNIKRKGPSASILRYGSEGLRALAADLESQPSEQEVAA